MKAAKQGIQEFNEISELACENLLLKQIGRVHNEDKKAMASQARHSKGSIAAVGNQKKEITTGSLITRHSDVIKPNKRAVAPYTTRIKDIPKVVQRKGGCSVKNFLPKGPEIRATKAKKLLNSSLLPKMEKHTTSTSSPAKQCVNTKNTGIINKRKHGNPLGDVKHVYNPIGNNLRVATASGLVKRNKGGLNNIKRPGNPVLNVTRIATASRLAKRTHPGVV